MFKSLALSIDLASNVVKLVFAVFKSLPLSIDLAFNVAKSLAMSIDLAYKRPCLQATLPTSEWSRVRLEWTRARSAWTLVCANVRFESTPSRSDSIKSMTPSEGAPSVARSVASSATGVGGNGGLARAEGADHGQFCYIAAVGGWVLFCWTARIDMECIMLRREYTV